jgi:hypothetical protein
VVDAVGTPTNMEEASIELGLCGKAGSTTLRRDGASAPEPMASVFWASCVAHVGAGGQDPGTGCGRSSSSVEEAVS